MSVRELTLDQLGEVSRGRSRHRPRDAAHLYGGPFPFIQTGVPGLIRAHGEMDNPASTACNTPLSSLH